jgi:hypothetical protein
MEYIFFSQLLRCTRACAPSEDFLDKAGANKEVTEPRVGSSTVEVITSKVYNFVGVGTCLSSTYPMFST